MKRIKLTDPCPCGSGKKYRNCCLKKQEIDESSVVLGLVTGIDSLEEFDEYVAPLRAEISAIGAADELSVQIAIDCSKVAQIPEKRRQTEIDEIMQKYLAPAQKAGIDLLTLGEAIVMMITRYTKFFAKVKKAKRRNNCEQQLRRIEPLSSKRL